MCASLHKRGGAVQNYYMSFPFAFQYGGQEHLDAPPAELLLAQTEDYVEYSRHGTVIKGQEKAIACSKYEEDVKINNHTVSPSLC